MGVVEDIARKREITKRLKEVVADDKQWENTWKFCMNLAKFIHAPISLSDYKRMEKYVDDKELVSAVL